MCNASQICTYFIILLTFDRRRPWHCSLLPCSEERYAVGKVEECQEMHTCVNVHVYGCGQQGSVWVRVNRALKVDVCDLPGPEVTIKPDIAKPASSAQMCPLPTDLFGISPPVLLHYPVSWSSSLLLRAATLLPCQSLSSLHFWLSHKKPSRPWVHIQSWPVITVMSWGRFSSH